MRVIFPPVITVYISVRLPSTDFRSVYTCTGNALFSARRGGKNYWAEAFKAGVRMVYLLRIVLFEFWFVLISWQETCFWQRRQSIIPRVSGYPPPCFGSESASGDCRISLPFRDGRSATDTRAVLSQPGFRGGAGGAVRCAPSRSARRLQLLARRSGLLWAPSKPDICCSFALTSGLLWCLFEAHYCDIWEQRSLRTDTPGFYQKTEFCVV